MTTATNLCSYEDLVAMLVRDARRLADLKQALGVPHTESINVEAEAAQMAAREATADGINWNFSPMVDIARDPRWGRIAEGAGEDELRSEQRTQSHGLKRTRRHRAQRRATERDTIP